MNSTRALRYVGAVVFLVGCGDPSSSPFGGADVGGAPAGHGGKMAAAGGKSGGAAGAGGSLVVDPPGGGGAPATSSGGAAGTPVVGAGGSGATAAGGGPASSGGRASGGSGALGGATGTGGKLGTGGAGGTPGTAGRGGATGIGAGGAGGALQKYCPDPLTGVLEPCPVGTGGAPAACHPGDVQSCQGVSCTGTATCTSAGQWGACPCSPPPPGTGGAGGGAGGSAGGAGGTCTETPGPPSTSSTCPNPDGSGSTACGQQGKVCWNIGVCGNFDTRCVTPCSAITCAADQVKQQDLGQDCKCVGGTPPPTFHGLPLCPRIPATDMIVQLYPVPGCPQNRQMYKTAPDGTKFTCNQCYAWAQPTASYYTVAPACASTQVFGADVVYCATTCADCDP